MTQKIGIDEQNCDLTRRQWIVSSLMGLAVAKHSLAEELSRAPCRLISIGGVLTEIVYLLSLEKLLVGVDLTSNYPAHALTHVQLGYLRQLSTEGLISLRPNLILALEEAGPPHVIAHIRRMGIPLYFFKTAHDLSTLQKNILQVGDLLDAKAQASQLSRQITDEYLQWQERQASMRDVHREMRIMFLMSHVPGKIMVAGGDTSADRMIRLIGSRNVFDFNGLKPVAAESVIAANPDLLLVTTQTIRTFGGVEKVWSLPGLLHTKAYQRRALIAMDAMYLLGFGPRLPQALTELSQRVHDVSNRIFS